MVDFVVDDVEQQIVHLAFVLAEGVDRGLEGFRRDPRPQPVEIRGRLIQARSISALGRASREKSLFQFPLTTP
jgi:hypothetical protein